MEHIVVIKHFNQIAITNKLTGLQMQLWHEIFTRVCEAKQDLCISTAELLELLQVSRCQFQRARSGLVQAGLLAMRKVSNQKVYYTVQLNGESVAVCSGSESVVQVSGLPKEKPMPKTAQYPKEIDVICTDYYRNEIITFCNNLPSGSTNADILELETELMNWCMMRKENGWQLTKQGLEVLLQKLKTLRSEVVPTMLEIVRTSIRRRWKGFYELRAESKPSGKKLLELERKAQKSDNSRYGWKCENSFSYKRNYKTPGRLPKYDTKKEDLDFLEW